MEFSFKIDRRSAAVSNSIHSKSTSNCFWPNFNLVSIFIPMIIQNSRFHELSGLSNTVYKVKHVLSCKQGFLSLHRLGFLNDQSMTTLTLFNEFIQDHDKKKHRTGTGACSDFFHRGINQIRSPVPYFKWLLLNY